MVVAAGMPSRRDVKSGAADTHLPRQVSKQISNGIGGFLCFYFQFKDPLYKKRCPSHTIETKIQSLGRANACISKNAFGGREAVFFG